MAAPANLESVRELLLEFAGQFERLAAEMPVLSGRPRST